MKPYAWSSYLGYGLQVFEDRVVVLDRAGRRLGEVSSVKQARLFVRGYRRAEKGVAA